MPVRVIDDFIKQYSKEFDFYQKLSQIVAGKIEDQLSKRGIKAIVTSRAKRPESLRDKISKRNKDKNYETVQDVYDDIVDLSGIRVSLYFPSERTIIDEVINELFIIEKKKEFPDVAHTPKYTKRFSGYWATHYRVKLKEDKSLKRYADTLSEIQVASVLMHAWSEVEHDLVYKPFSGDLSREELAILDEINGLVLSGEIALERLQEAMANRTKNQDDLTDKYALTNFLINNFSKEDLAKVKLGNTYPLNKYLNTTKNFKVNDIYKYINLIDTNSTESVTDQLLDMLLVDSDEAGKLNLKNYFKNLQFSEKNASSFEAFVRSWVVLEKAIRQIQTSSRVTTRQHFVPNFEILVDKEILTKEEINDLRRLKQIRNHLLHGIESPSEEYLRESYKVLQFIARKVIQRVLPKTAKTQLEKEINSIS